MLHVPVLQSEVLEMATSNHFEPKTYLDCTFGRGGHASLFKQKFPQLKVVALDRDQQAIEYGKQHFSEFTFYHTDYLHLDEVLPKEMCFDLILADLGVSSPQLDQADRGFSFYHDGPLDMRMDQTQSLTAAEIVNEWDEEDLEKLFHEYGEIPKPNRVVRAICHDRKEKPFTTTRELAGLIERVDGWGRKGMNPATKYFMALRLQVNNELDQLEESLSKMVDRLNIHGRLLVITFHSLEDRICKYAFRKFTDRGNVINKKVVAPKYSETQGNSRSRSAKLRGFERGEA